MTISRMTQKLRSHFRKNGERITSALATATEEKDKAEKELAELKAQLPRILASYYLGDLPQGKLVFVRRRIRQLKVFLEEFPSLFEELTVIQSRQQTKGRLEAIRIDHLERTARRFEFLKAQLEHHRSPDLENEFLLYAKELAAELGEDVIAEAKAFLESCQGNAEFQKAALAE